MKRFISIFLLFLCLSSNSLYAEEWDSLFSAANEAYKKKDFTLCVMLLDSIHHQGYGSENTYYNLGNAYYKLQNFPYAILNYERAARIAPYNKEIAQNLRMANKQLAERVSAMPVFFLFVWTKNVIDVFSANTWQIISFLLLMGGIIAYFFYYQNKQKRLIRLSLALFVFSFIAFFAFFQKNKYETRKDEAIVVVAEINLKKAPGMGTENVTKVPVGAKVLIVSELGEWIMVSLPNGEKGWIERKNLEVI
jgi:tetratricopeptide (TPR) repeat protein